MDTGKVIATQLRYCLAGAETPEQEAQVTWWIEKIAELRKDQPSAESQQLEMHPATGTEG